MEESKEESRKPAHRVTISAGELYANDFTVQQTVTSSFVSLPLSLNSMKR